MVVVLRIGLVKDIWAKCGDERRNCRVAGTGYRPASKNTTKLAIAPAMCLQYATISRSDDYKPESVKIN